MSSAWWLGPWCMLGFGAKSQTPANLARTGDCVLNLRSPAQATSVDAIALFTGIETVPPNKLGRGYRYEPNKFERLASPLSNRSRSALTRANPR